MSDIKTVRVNATLHKKVKNLAKKRNISMRQLVRDILKASL